MALLRTVFRRTGRPPRALPAVAAPPPTDVTLEFSSSTTDSGGGVFGVVNSADPNIAFSFTEITPRVGLPRDLEVSESGTLKLVVTFTSDYDGQPFVYTDSSGNAHAGTFPSGNGTVNY